MVTPEVERSTELTLQRQAPAVLTIESPPTNLLSRADGADHTMQIDTDRTTREATEIDNEQIDPGLAENKRELEFLW